MEVLVVSVELNCVYRHFKGNLYRVLAVALNTETEEQMVVYQDVVNTDKVFVRPMDNFLSKVDRTKYPDVKQENRFELLRTAVVK